jgi:hypothetical protein
LDLGNVSLRCGSRGGDAVKIWYGNRASGKTTSMLREAARNQGIMLVHDDKAASHVLRQVNELGLAPYVLVMPYRRFLQPGLFFDRRPVYIDNIDMFARYVCAAMMNTEVNGFSVPGALPYLRVFDTDLEAEFAAP